MQRYTRLHREPEDMDPSTINPYEAGVHQWKIDDPRVENARSLEECFQAIDEKAVKKAAIAALKDDPEIIPPMELQIQNKTVTLIQCGGQLGIFQVDVQLRANGTPKVVQLIAAVSRNSEVDDYIKRDHESITAFRAGEAQEMNVAVDSAEYHVRSTFPKHYHSYTASNGAFVYIAEFCKGYVELNLVFRDSNHSINGDSIDRIVGLNGLNQGSYIRLVDPLESSRIMKRIIEHQVETAARAKTILTPAFMAGDYMYDPEKDALMLQCYRVPELAEVNAIISKASEMMISIGVHPRTLAVAHQLLQVIVAQEMNLPEMKEPLTGLQFTYSQMDIASAIGAMRRDGMLIESAEWKKVQAVVCQMGGMILSAHPDPSKQRQLNTRLQFANLALMGSGF